MHMHMSMDMHISIMAARRSMASPLSDQYTDIMPR